MTRLRWFDAHDGGRRLEEVDKQGFPLKSHRERARVWPPTSYQGAVWHTFDRDGVGGENSEENDLYTAIRLATAAVVMHESRAGRSVLVLEESPVA